MIELVSIFTEEYKSNTYLLINAESKSAIIIDPTIQSVKGIEEQLHGKHLKIDYIIPTHGHFDHIEGIGILVKKYKFDIIGTAESRISFCDSKKNYSFYFQNKNLTIDPPNMVFNEETFSLEWFKNIITIIKTPGHSPCSICIAVNGEYLFSGDSILLEFSPFSKFPDGDSGALIRSITKIYSTMPHSLTVYPGHGARFMLGDISSCFSFLTK